MGAPLVDRVPSHLWTVLDNVLAATYALFAWMALVHDPGNRWLAGAVALLVAASLAGARRRPVLAFALGLAAFWLAPFGSMVAFLALPPTMWALYRVAAGASFRVALMVLAAAMTGPIAATLPDLHGMRAVYPVTVTLAAPWVAGYISGQRRRQARELVRHAVTGERLRIARDMHDVVAHGMSVITVQAGYGQLVVDGRPEQARLALEVIESTGRETLVEMRRLLGVLRDEPGGRAGVSVAAPLAPAPGLDTLDRLLEQSAAAGVVVEFVVTGERRPLSAGTELTAYRVLQEALTNVAKHAATDRAGVVVHYAPAELVLEVTDAGRGGAEIGVGGRGLAGMRERVGLYGGSLTAGPLPGGGFRVLARLPG